MHVGRKTIEKGRGRATGALATRRRSYRNDDVRGRVIFDHLWVNKWRGKLMDDERNYLCKYNPARMMRLHEWTWTQSRRSGETDETVSLM